MTFKFFRAFAMMIALFAAKSSVAQLSYYYQNGESKTEAMLSEQSSASYVTQMTYYNFEFVRDRVHNCLTEILPFTPFQEYKTVKQGEYEVISRMYKNKYNDDIAPDRRYIQIEYKTAVVEGERFIVSARVNGLSDYVGEFYGGFWMPKIDAKIVSSGEIMGTPFLQDYVSVQTKMDTKKREQIVWIEITNKEIKDFQKFKSALAAKRIADRKAREAFNKRRAGTTFMLKDVSAESYAKMKDAIDNAVNNGLVELKENYDLDLSVNVAVDTTGKLTTTFSKDTPLNERIERAVNNAYFSKYKENDVYMFTKDVFTFNGSKKSETGQVLLKGEVLDFKSGNSQTFEQEVTASKERLSRGRGLYDLTVTSIDMNGTKSAVMTVDSFKEKKSTLYYIVGGVAILGGGGYYLYTMFFNN
jgi:hypothetical protein